MTDPAFGAFRVARRCPAHFAACVVAAALSACGGSLQVTPLKTDQAPPNNVWVFFTVQKGKEPVAGLASTDFEIYEDDQIVSKYESKQTIQNPGVAAVMYTQLLLDMSGSVTESGQAGALVDAADQFTRRVGKTQKVGVYAFDGAEKFIPSSPSRRHRAPSRGGLEGLRSYKATRRAPTARPTERRGARSPRSRPTSPTVASAPASTSFANVG